MKRGSPEASTASFKWPHSSDQKSGDEQQAFVFKLAYRRRHALSCFIGAGTLMTVFSFKCLSASCLCAADPPSWSTSFLRFHNRLASSAFMTAGNYNAKYKVQSSSAIVSATSAGAVTRTMGRGACTMHMVPPCINKSLQLTPARVHHVPRTTQMCVLKPFEAASVVWQFSALKQQLA